MKFHYVETAKEVLEIALLKQKVKQPVDLTLIEPKSKEKE